MDDALHIDVLTADVKSLQELLTDHKTTSQHLMEFYLAQIKNHDDCLHAMIQTTPRDLALDRARVL